MQQEIEQAVRLIKQGGVIIFPTDTAYGIGCRIDDEKAVERLFAIRKRAETKATPVLVSDIEMAQDYLQPLSDAIKDTLINKYWPGALTIVLPCRKENVPDLVRGGGETLGVRMPNHPTALEIIKGVGVPILGPSANFAGEPTPYEFGDLDSELVKMVDYVVSGKCTIKHASTVIDCSVEPWKVLREGGIKFPI
jgi:L-threonylcarbamoyladenylate synthase